MRPLPSPSQDNLDIMRHGNGCSSVEQHLQDLKVVPDDVDDEQNEEDEVGDEESSLKIFIEDGNDKICTYVQPG